MIKLYKNIICIINVFFNDVPYIYTIFYMISFFKNNIFMKPNYNFCNTYLLYKVQKLVKLVILLSSFINIDVDKSIMS